MAITMRYMDHNRPQFNRLNIIPMLCIGMVSFFLFSAIASATNCGVALTAKGQVSSAGYVTSIKACIDTQYLSCGVPEPATTWHLSGNGFFPTEVQAGQIIRAEHIKAMQAALDYLANNVPAAALSAAGGPNSIINSFTHNFINNNYVGSPLSFKDLNEIINDINKFQCSSLCPEAELPLNDTAADFPPTPAPTSSVTGVCDSGINGSALANCAAAGTWGPVTGTCCASNETWFVPGPGPAGSCCTINPCALDGPCAGGSAGCGLGSGYACSCIGGQDCVSGTCECSGSDVVYNGSCCTPTVCDMGGSCGAGSDGCGGVCTCVVGQTCSAAGICTDNTDKITVASILNSPNAVANACPAGCHCRDLGSCGSNCHIDENDCSSIYNSESCDVTTVNSAVLILFPPAVRPTIGIPVINGGCGDQATPEGEPNTTCSVYFGSIVCPAVSGAPISNDQKFTGDLFKDVPNATQQFKCDKSQGYVQYSNPADNSPYATYTCVSNGTTGTWNLTDPCMAPCKRANLTVNQDGSGTVVFNQSSYGTVFSSTCTLPYVDGPVGGPPSRTCCGGDIFNNGNWQPSGSSCSTVAAGTWGALPPGNGCQ
jgi:hypothetical protein